MSLSLGPVPQGEISAIIREPAEILRRKVGPDLPVFDAQSIEKLQSDFAGEADALPLLAFVLQRMILEHAGEPVIGLSQLDRSGGMSSSKRSKWKPMRLFATPDTRAAPTANVARR